MSFLAITVLSCYALLAMLLLVYGLNCLVMVYLFWRKYNIKTQEQAKFECESSVSNWPTVTTQIPVFNEANVIERIIEAVTKLEYPGHHHIQVLDDSNDITSSLIDAKVKTLTKKGIDIDIVRRDDRTGYKAGALAHAHDLAKGEYIAVFDADFVPTSEFLIKTIPYFIATKKLGLIQARWGHLNENKSMLTKIQALGIDGHFMVEQSARCWNNLCMNFNGTAGIWRKKAIESGGGWSSDTLTEDMDLSYRVQMKGWETEYLPSLVVPAELPEELRALKSQQFRWAKGSTQTALKILPKLWRQEGFSFRWAQAFLHMTHYLVHPLMIMVALLSWPVIHYSQLYSLSSVWQLVLMAIFLISMLSTNALYIVSQIKSDVQWLRKIRMLPCLMVLGVGLAVNNTKAVVEALMGYKTEFVRTPKKGDATTLAYKMKTPWPVVVELIMGSYCFMTLVEYISFEKFLLGPFVAIYAVGFLCVGMITLLQSFCGKLKFLRVGDSV